MEALDCKGLNLVFSKLNFKLLSKQKLMQTDSQEDEYISYENVLVEN